MLKRKHPNPRYEFPVLAHVPCPACGKEGAWVSATGQNAALYISCRACGGRMIKAPFVMRYLLGLRPDQVEFQNGWSRKHLEELAEQYKTTIPRLARVHGAGDVQVSERAVAAVPCPSCSHSAEVRLTAKTAAPFLHCSRCNGQIVGAKATVAYLLRNAENMRFFSKKWEAKYPGLVSRYW